MDFAVGTQDSPAVNGRNGQHPVHADGTIAHVVPSDYLRWSGGLNRLIAAILLLPGLPIIGLLILIVRMTSKGPGVYRQVRVGYHGRLFDVLKIRTMREDAEVGTGAVWTAEQDPRITRVGWFLRLTHLDELPQLFNVLKGEMNLIGPRPERPEFTEHLSVEIHDYLQRVNVRPGVTGLAQINLPPDTDTDSVRRKLILDLEYVRTASLSMDLRILMCTLVRLLGIRGTLPARVLRLKRKVVLPTDQEASCENTLVANTQQSAKPMSAEHLRLQIDSSINGNASMNGNGAAKVNGHSASGSRSKTGHVASNHAVHLLEARQVTPT
jgi:lipopolysaccharide/colanic/teichoic acid biosynthesis glycosyltransferase